MDRDESFGALTAALDYPMFVVTASGGGRRAGCLVGFATQCSIDPPRFLVCISRENHTCRVAHEAEALAVHVLDRRQEALAELFGAHTGDETDKFAQCRWAPGWAGAPVLDDCPNRFVGQVVDRLDLGDHVGHILEVVEASAGDIGSVLTFQQVRDLRPGHPA